MKPVENFFSFIKTLWYAPFIIFLIGFFYVQGAFSPFLSDGFPFKSILLVTPVSYNLYITNGILASTLITIPLILAYLIARYAPVSYKLKRFFKEGPFKSLLFILINIIILVVISKLQFVFAIKLAKLFNIRLIYIVVYFLYFLSASFFYKFHNVIFKRAALYKAVSTLYYSFFLIVSLVMTVYLNGLLTQNQIIENYTKSEEKLHYMKITNHDNEQINLLRFDVNADYIIGYDMTSNRMQIIPKETVKKIETFSSAYLHNKLEYNPNNNKNTEDAAIISTIEGYYNYLTKNYRNTNDTKEFLGILSSNFKYMNFNGINTVNSKILTNKMNHEPYRNIDLNEYFGIVCSVPESIPSEKNDLISYKLVYVKEYWKDQSFGLAITLISRGEGVWEINNIEKTDFSFVQ